MAKMNFSPFSKQKKADDPYNSVKTRDVYAAQDMERGELGGSVSWTARAWLGGIVTVGSFVCCWYIITLGFVASNSILSSFNLADSRSTSIWSNLFDMWLMKLGVSSLLTLIISGLVWSKLWRNYKTQQARYDNTDINQYDNDQHVALPSEIMDKFEWFPDVGAHASPQVSSMISHVMLSNKGILPVEAAEFYTSKDAEVKNGEVLAGEHKVDEDGDVIFSEKPFFDKEFGEALFDTSGISKKLKKYRKFWDATKISYNPDGSNRDKIGQYNTVADMINDDWELPYFEPQRPAGAYLVDTAPVNTMVLAMTRAGKGQGVIEPTIDMWLREKENNNIVINDPKGELLSRFYVRATARGFQVVQFNLINPLNTDIYNPLMLAAEAAREGNTTDAAMFINNIADVFFPVDGGDDPFWPNAASNAFKRTAFELIDNLLEQEKEMRQLAVIKGTDPKVLATDLDKLWGECTLYNAYQFFTNTTSKKLKNPVTLMAQKMKADLEKPESEREHSNNEWDEKIALAKKQAEAWDGNDEVDIMTLYSNATAKLPRNSMRTLVSNADNSLRAMGAAEKTISSVYGIAITSMNFFTDPTISTLTSGTPSQTVDLAGLSFPRRLGVRFDPDYVAKQHMVGARARFKAYTDNTFTKELGKDFEHNDTVSRIGWAKYYPKGIFENKSGYIKLEIFDRLSKMLIDTFYFEFVKQSQLDVTGRYYLEDPILGERIVKDGILYELQPFKKKVKSGTKVVYRRKVRMMDRKEIRMEDKNDWTVYDGKTPVIINTSVHYAEKQKSVFLVTPPHLLGYAKLILILIKQLADLSLGMSYLVKDNQAPLYKTRFMLDEVGNLQSEGHGIQGLQTYLSIGLSAGQQFTLILQTLQQLRDVYGESVDKIVQGNASNIVFLKSTDDDMLKTLETMSGITHKARSDSKTITTDMSNLTNLNRNEGKMSYNVATKEEPVISFNDMAFIPDRNSMLFRAGDSPIWNRNEMVLPMSWRLFQNTIINPEEPKYTLQTVPTLSTAMDFDVRKNQPDFMHWFNKRLSQMTYVDEAIDMYKSLHNYSDRDVEMLDPDVYADDIMRIVNTLMNPELVIGEDDEVDYENDPMLQQAEEITSMAEDNDEVINAAHKAEKDISYYTEKVFVKGLVSRGDFVNYNGMINRSWDETLKRSYEEDWQKYYDDEDHFTIKGERSDGYGAHRNLMSADGREVYIRFGKRLKRKDQRDLALLARQTTDRKSRVYADDNLDELKDMADKIASVEVTDAYYRYLASLTTAEFSKLAGGALQERIYREQTSDV